MRPPPYRRRRDVEEVQRALDETPEAQDARLKRELWLMMAAAFGAFVAGLIVIAFRSLPGEDVPTILPDWMMLALLVGAVVVLMGRPRRKRNLLLLALALAAVCAFSVAGFFIALGDPMNWPRGPQ